MAEKVPRKYQMMRCQACRRLIKPNKALAASLGKRTSVHSREDCIYRCECGVAYSNGVNERERVLITVSPELNVPKAVRPGLVETLGQAANHTNRAKKLFEFCSENSEDAITWTVFRGLQQRGRLDALVAPEHPHGEPALLLWGVPLGGDRAPEVASALAEACGLLGEKANELSEPDVIVVWPELTVLIEAKFLGKNERQPNHRNFDRYLDRPELFAASPDEVAAAGYYELTRNWRIGAALAERLQTPGFLLINLGPPEKIEVDADIFMTLVKRVPLRQFASCSWSDVLEAAKPLEAWLDRYASERHRLLYWR